MSVITFADIDSLVQLRLSIDVLELRLCSNFNNHVSQLSLISLDLTNYGVTLIDVVFLDAC